MTCRTCNGPIRENLHGEWAHWGPAAAANNGHTPDPTGETLRDAAMQKVDDAAPDTWRTKADDAIKETAFRHYSFTSDEVWEVLDEWGVPRPPEARALGPAMTRAAKNGYMEPLSSFRPSRRPELHASPRRLYRSRLYGEDSRMEEWI